MSALWSTLGSTFSAVSSFDGAFCFLFVLITCWSLIFPMLHKKRWLKKTSRSSAVVCMKLYLLNLSFCTLQTSPSRLTIFFQSCNTHPKLHLKKALLYVTVALNMLHRYGFNRVSDIEDIRRVYPLLDMNDRSRRYKTVSLLYSEDYAKVYGTFQLPFYFHNTTYSR